MGLGVGQVLEDGMGASERPSVCDRISKEEGCDEAGKMDRGQAIMSEVV